MLPKGILFDLDDTIIQFGSMSDAIWAEVCVIFFTECGLPGIDDLLRTISETREWFWTDPGRNKAFRQDLENARRKMTGIALEKIGISDTVLADKIADTYTELREKRIKFFPGAEETLRHLKENNVAMALMTNGNAAAQRDKVKRFGLEKYFDAILIEGETGFGKPDREVYIMALESLKLDSGDVWAVGDNLEWDVQGPQQLGIFGIWNDYGKKGLPPDTKIVPDRIVNSIVELIM